MSCRERKDGQRTLDTQRSGRIVSIWSRTQHDVRGVERYFIIEVRSA